jgi:hypothetical protein
MGLHEGEIAIFVVFVLDSTRGDFTRIPVAAMIAARAANTSNTNIAPSTPQPTARRRRRHRRVPDAPELRAWVRYATQRGAAGWYASRDPVLRAEHLERAEDPEAARAFLAWARSQTAEYRQEVALRLVERGSR